MKNLVLKYFSLLPSLEERKDYISKHLELLEPVTDKILEELMNEVKSKANKDDLNRFHFVEGIQYIRDELNKCRLVGVEEAFIEFQSEQNAQLTKELYKINTKINDLNNRSNSINICNDKKLSKDWLDIICEPEFYNLPSFIQQYALLNSTVCALIRIRQCNPSTASFSDLTSLKEYLETALEQFKNTPRKGRLLSTLAECYTEDYNISGNVKKLRRSVEIHQEAINLTPEYSPRWSTHLAGLVDASTKLYNLKGSQETLETAISSFEMLLLSLQKRDENHNILASEFLKFSRLLSDAYEKTSLQLYFERAIDTADIALSFLPSDISLRSMISCVQGNLYWMKYYYESTSPNDLTCAYNHLTKGLSDIKSYSGSKESAVKVQIFLVLGNILSEQFSISKKRELLNYWVETAKEALHLAKSIEDRSNANINYSRSLVKSATTTSRQVVLDEAIGNLQNIITNEITEDQKSNLNFHLGNFLNNRFALTGNLVDLELSSKAYEYSLASIPKDSIFRGDRLNNIGSVARQMFDRTHNVENLNHAINAFRESVKLSQSKGTNIALFHHNLGFSLRQLFQVTQNKNLLKEAIREHEISLNLSISNGTNHPIYLSNYASTLMEIYWLQPLQADYLKRAIQARREALSLTSVTSNDYIQICHQLGASLHESYILTHDVEILKEANDLYYESANSGLEFHTTESFIASRNWLLFSFDCEDWQGVVEAHTLHAKAARILYKSQISRSAKESWIKDSKDLASKTAYALAKLRQPELAVSVLEQSRTQLISEALELDKDQLNNLDQIGKIELREHLQDALKSLDSLKKIEGELDVQTWADSMQAVQQKVDSAIEAIRVIPGYEKFLKPIKFEDLDLGSLEHPLVFLAYTPAGGVAFIAGSNEINEIKIIWLPNLTNQSLNTLLYGDNKEQHLNSYFGAYDLMLENSADDFNFKCWADIVDKVTNWLWDNVIEFVIEAIDKHEKRVNLIPTGMLSTLPLHAACYFEDKIRKYALDKIEICYLPNISVLYKAKSFLASLDKLRPLVIHEPTPIDRLPLPASIIELEAVNARFDNTIVLSNDEATRDAVLNKLPTCNVVHFACHGKAENRSPLDNGLWMSNDTLLSTRDFLTLNYTSSRLAVLSACETGAIGLELPDELVGIPTSLIKAGFAGVISSLWQVYDESTAILMAYFYISWSKDSIDPATALNQAQKWTRDSTNGIKAEFLESLLNEQNSQHDSGNVRYIAMHKLISKLKKNPQDQFYKHPIFWAGFIYMGI